MRDKLYNQRFDDIYFSPEDGLAETRHVFLDGNYLPERFKGRDRFTIVETGFGTGLNFLAAWDLFEKTAGEDAALDYVSFELYPLSASRIKEALAEWQFEWGERLEKLLALYPIRTKGFHRLQLSRRVSLTLVFDDVNEALPELAVPRGVDAWFLDGFAPAKNPQMWTEELFSQMARLSAESSTVATFTVAGHVRRGLEEAGFTVEKTPGFGRKREMVVARFNGGGDGFENKNKTNRIAIIGGGLAGTSCAFVLEQQNIKTVIFEKGDCLAAGASGNVTGLYNPRLSALRSAESDFYVAAYAQAVRSLKALTDVEFYKSGSLHLANSEDKEKRFRSLLESWGWHEEHMQYLSAAQASDQAGVKLETSALFLPDAGSVSPQKLCAAYAQSSEVRLGVSVQTLEKAGGVWLVNGELFDAVIIAAATAVKDFDVLSWLPVTPVRGQVSVIKETLRSEKIKSNICYGGYISAPCNGQHVVGATFEKWIDGTDVREESHRTNLDKMAMNIHGLGDDISVTGGKAAFRTASHDHFPVIGPVPDEDENDYAGLYVSTAHGSHGIVSSLTGAYLLADMILGRALCLPQKSVTLLHAARFLKRARRRRGR